MASSCLIYLNCYRQIGQFKPQCHLPAYLLLMTVGRNPISIRNGVSIGDPVPIDGRGLLFLGGEIKIRNFSAASISHTQSLVLVVKVRRCGMVHRSIIPYGAGLWYPSESDLQIVILGDCIEEHLHEIVRLGLGDVVDVVDVETDSVDRVETGDRVCADNGMFGGEVLAGVQGMTSGFGPELEAASFLC